MVLAWFSHLPDYCANGMRLFIGWYTIIVSQNVYIGKSHFLERTQTYEHSEPDYNAAMSFHLVLQVGLCLNII